MPGHVINGKAKEVVGATLVAAIRICLLMLPSMSTWHWMQSHHIRNTTAFPTALAHQSCPAHAERLVSLLVIACVTCRCLFCLMRHLFQYRVAQRPTGTANGGLAGARDGLGDGDVLRG